MNEITKPEEFHTNLNGIEVVGTQAAINTNHQGLEEVEAMVHFNFKKQAAELGHDAVKLANSEK